MNSDYLQTQWTRSKNGWLAGVCEGMAKNLDMNPGMVRLIWLASVLFFGFGAGLYLIFAFIMPTEGETVSYSNFLGVCGRLSEKLEIDIVPLRIFTIMALISSAGTVMVGYFILHILLPRSLNESV